MSTQKPSETTHPKINMVKSIQLAIIQAFTALWVSKFKQMAPIWILSKIKFKDNFKNQCKQAGTCIGCEGTEDY